MYEGYSIVMFAYNEEKNIQKSITSVLSNVDDNLNQFTVIANGCNDSTASIVKHLIGLDSTNRLTLVELDVGDKCNAWNTYVYKLAHSSEIHFFLDADVRFTTDVFPKMYSKLMQEENVNAIAGLPFSGRNMSQYKSMVENKYCLFGNCYGLKANFIELVIKKGFKLPIGLGWIDSAITKVVNTDVGDITQPKKGKVTFDDTCGYEFDSLSLFHKDDWQLYINRITRYRLGKMQETHLDKLAFTEWPDTLHEINKTVLSEIKANSPWYSFLERKLVVDRIQKFSKKSTPSNC
jgi:glycosyltransferase involved in cell wall biosynthesis